MDQYLLFERDGVITVKTDQGITTADECVILPFVQEALFELEQQGVKAIVLDDQSELVPAKLSLDEIPAIYAQMKKVAEELGGRFWDILTCPGEDTPASDCAFPLPGLIQKAAQKYAIDLATTYMITSSWNALQAAWAAGCKTAFVKTGKPFQTLQQLKRSEKQPDFICQDLLTAVVHVCRK